ncbi:hypothetical protein KAF80_16295 [Bacillus sp. WL1]|uniref:hypothetical protein n=1 Tax=Bacillus sp. WL1 TaxID=2822693 RepID=UPI001B332A2E|nr:hypothetical protein [Bacillus sp. WL1]MBP3970591.1 hypothetical protein [Bacillus sp. WL1]
MTILRDSWFTVKQIAQNTYAISEYGHWEKVHSILNTKKVFPYKKTPFTFYIFYLQSQLKAYLPVQMYAFGFYLQQMY